MISLRLIRRSEWEAKLRHLGCAPQEGVTKLNTAEFWAFPWKGYPFTVPVESNGRMTEQNLHRTMAMVRGEAPEGWSFD